MKKINIERFKLTRVNLAKLVAQYGKVIEGKQKIIDGQKKIEKKKEESRKYLRRMEKKKEEDRKYLRGIDVSWDGDMVCVLYGDDVQDGVCGFGKSEKKAITAFCNAWLSQIVTKDKKT